MERFRDWKNVALLALVLLVVLTNVMGRVGRYQAAAAPSRGPDGTLVVTVIDTVTGQLRACRSDASVCARYGNAEELWMIQENIREHDAEYNRLREEEEDR